MDEVDSAALTPEGFEKLISGDVEDLSDEMLLVLRGVQSYEAMELDAPEDHLERIYEWGTQTLSQMAALRMVLRGELYVFWKEDENDICFKLAPPGLEVAQALGFEGVPQLPDIEDFPKGW